MTQVIILLIAFLAAIPLMSHRAVAYETHSLAKKLANPIAALISLAILANHDENIGPTDDGSTWQINIQPVIPFSIGDKWTLISRTVLPVIDQSDVPVKGVGESVMRCRGKILTQRLPPSIQG